MRLSAFRFPSFGHGGAGLKPAPTPRGGKKTSKTRAQSRRENEGCCLADRTAEENDDRAICGALQCREGCAGAPLLHRFQILAELPVQAVPQSKTLPRRAERLPETQHRAHPARHPISSAAANHCGNAAGGRPARAYGARVFADGLFWVANLSSPACGGGGKRSEARGGKCSPLAQALRPRAPSLPFPAGGGGKTNELPPQAEDLSPI